MQDFGNDNFNKIFQKNDLHYLLKLAVDNLIIIQNSVTSDDLLKLKKYTFNDQKKEISEFIEYYIPYKKIYNFPIDEFYNYWESIYRENKFIFSNFAHKDFEFMNLIYLKENNNHFKCGIIDFQNAFLGFIGWDLFSILENPRIIFTRKYNEDLIKYFYDNVDIKMDLSNFRSQYYILNLGRLTRLLGRWVKLYKERNNKLFLNYLYSTQNRITFCLQNIKNEKLKKFYSDILLDK